MRALKLLLCSPLLALLLVACATTPFTTSGQYTSASSMEPYLGNNWVGFWYAGGVSGRASADITPYGAIFRSLMITATPGTDWQKWSATVWVDAKGQLILEYHTKLGDVARTDTCRPPKNGVLYCTYEVWFGDYPPGAYTLHKSALQ